jgi:RsiW-degrading membrane proteinase PrsW (M82 family)
MQSNKGKEAFMLTENNQTRDYPLITRLLIACGAIGPLLFILVFLVESATRPNYSAWHNFVSDLSESNQGWTQIASFLLCGMCVVCFALGLRQVFGSGKGAIWGPLLLGVFGLSLIIAGSFVTDPSLGYYPPGTSSSTHTLHGTIHGANAPLAFGSLTIAIFVLTRRFAFDHQWRGWVLYSLVTGILLVGFFIACLVVAILDQKGILPDSPTGLLERIAIIIGWGWIALLALQILRQMRWSAFSVHSTTETTLSEHVDHPQAVE